MSGKQTGRRLEIQDELHDILSRRLSEKWDSVRHFTLTHMRTMGLSPETVRRAFKADPLKGIEAHTLAIIMHHLDYSRDEIVELLRTYTSDTIISGMMMGGPAATEMELTPEESTFLAVARRIKERVPDLYINLAQSLKPLATAYQINAPELAELDRTVSKKRR
jgi:hypothetical protein